jgi:large subunit ribosomal protein L35
MMTVSLSFPRAQLIGAPLSKSLEKRIARPVRAAVAVRKRRAFGCNKETKMPKLKTKSGVKKRFKLTATGLLKHGVAGKRHRLISHNSKYIRQNRGTEVLDKADTARVKGWAPYGLN